MRMRQRSQAPRPLVQKEFGDLPGVGVEEVKAMLDSGAPVQIIDARPRSYISRQQDIMDGAVWRDPERIQDWIGGLSKSDPVVVFVRTDFSGMQDGHHATRGWIRRKVHERWPLGVESDRGPAQAVHVAVHRDCSSTERNAALMELMFSISNGGIQ